MVRQTSSRAQALRILHVDDHPANRRLVRDVLLAFGHDPIDASSGAEALAELVRRPFDVVLMDINMPGMSGIEVVRRLRAAAGPERRTPVIALTSEFDRTPEDYLALGFNGFVAKPFAISCLAEAIQIHGVASRSPTLSRKVS